MPVVGSLEDGLQLRIIQGAVMKAFQLAELWQCAVNVMQE